jgi:ABC-2 type transport system ATP-binding protein
MPNASITHEPRLPESNSAAPALLFEQVSKWYGPVIGVNQVTLELHRGITGLVGANGAGKTTLLRLATGQLQPDIGQVTIRGVEAWNWRAKRLVGYCPESDVFYEEMSGFQFVESMALLCGMTRRQARERTEAAIEQVGMVGRSDRKIRGYSKGMRQRIKLAQALLQDPKLLILDEPLSGIDPIGRQDFVDLFFALAEQDRCLLISSHELEELEKLTNHIAIMARGRIAAVGSIAKIRDLLDQHPITIRMELADPRRTAALLLGHPAVVGIDLGPSQNELIARVANARGFFADFGRLVIEYDLQVQHLETIDDSTQAILGYLLGGRSG